MTIIKCKKCGNDYRIVIKDYEHIPFVMSFDFDDYFGYTVWIKDMSENRYIISVDSSKDYDIKTALIRLGYYIGTRF